MTKPVTVRAPKYDAEPVDLVARHGDPGGVCRRTVTLYALSDVTRNGDVIVMDTQGRDVARIPSHLITTLERGGRGE
jgi:hypothetical protein